MKLAIDIDGILANFIPAYQSLFVTVTGKDLFHPGDNIDPPTWDWPALRGYTKEECAAVWGVIKQDENFWFNLPPHPDNCAALAEFFGTGRADDHEVYFITSRPGMDTKFQTEHWLMIHPRVFDSTVLIVGHRQKGAVVKALGLDAYIDDNYDNCIDCVRESPTTRTYVLARRYNQFSAAGVHPIQVLESRRVSSLHAFFFAEGLD